MVRRTIWSAVLLVTGCGPVLGGAPYRVYPHTQAKAALRAAQRECKPLVLHFVPNETIGAQQKRAYYGAKGGFPQGDLAHVIVVIIPSNKYPEFAKTMLVDDAGGLRTVSPYELTFTDGFSLTTVRETVEIWSGGT